MQKGLGHGGEACCPMSWWDQKRPLRSKTNHRWSEYEKKGYLFVSVRDPFFGLYIDVNCQVWWMSRSCSGSLLLTDMEQMVE